MVFVKEIPTRLEWQEFLDLEQIPITLSKSMEVKNYSGFVAMRLADFKAGVEVYVEDYSSDDLLELAGELGDRTKVIRFRFSADEWSACCASGAAGALAKHAGGLVFCDGFLTFEEIMVDFNKSLSVIKADSGNNNHKKLLSALAKQLPALSRNGNIFLDLPLGGSARGLIVEPCFPRNKKFEVSVLLWPLAKPANRFPFCRIPPHLQLHSSNYRILELLTEQPRWSYENPAAVAEIVDFTSKKLVPFFASIREPQKLAEAFLLQFSESTDLDDLEKTAMACAAAGKFEEAFMLFERAVKICNKPSYDFTTGELMPKHEKLIEFEERCILVLALIREQKYSEITELQTKWRSYTVKSCGLLALDKRQ